MVTPAFIPFLAGKYLPQSTFLTEGGPTADAVGASDFRKRIKGLAEFAPAGAKRWDIFRWNSFLPEDTAMLYQSESQSVSPESQPL